MKKVSILLKLCYKFSKKYMPSYLLTMTKPILCGILAILFLFISTINIKFIILGFLSIPLMCYAFWKGFVITYDLIPCAHSFLKETPQPFQNCTVKNQEGQFAKYVGFCALFTVVLYLPLAIYIQKTIPFSVDLFLNTNQLLMYSSKINKAFLINSIFIAPFLNYCLCAYYYKKEKENYFKLFLNCYKYLDILGLIIAIILTLISTQGGLIYLILAIFLNPFVYSINTFWYSSRVKD